MATIFKQANSKWAKKKYPKKCTIGGSGCGLVSVTNLLNEYDKYKDATPLTFYSYMVKGAVDGDGTKRAYVATALAHYGFKDVQRFQTKPISEAFKLMAKGYRGVFVMNSNKAGSNGVTWTTSGHYVAITDYKVKNGKHYLYVKDSSWRNHDGWLTYEEHMRGAVSDCIIGNPSELKAKSSNNIPSEKKASDKATKTTQWDKNVTLSAQKKFGTPQDGIISGQSESFKKYHTACSTASWKYGKGGSTLIGQIQRTVKVTADGQFGPATIKALQKALGVTADGYFGKQSLEAFTDYLNGKKTLNMDKPKSSTTTTTSSYTGTLPTTKMVKSNAQVIADTITWLKWHANDNSFHYGYTSKDKKIDAHHNGCYYCGTNTTTGGRSKKGILDYEKSYCCNPFIHAGFAHGGCVPTALTMCRKGTSWDYHKGKGYDKSALFTKIAKPSKIKDLPIGAVLCRDTHVAMYVGDGKIVHACHSDDNKRNSEKWNTSIQVETLTDANYRRFPRVYKFNSSVDTTSSLAYGEVSDRVGLWQKYLNWYFGKKVVATDRCYGDTTLKYTKMFQETEIGKGQGDGYVGNITINKARTIKK